MAVEWPDGPVLEALLEARAVVYMVPPSILRASFRWACDKKLRGAVVDFAEDSRRASPWARGICDRSIAKGHSHPHAVRILARAWLRVIWRCWQDGAAYDITKQRGAAVPIAA